MRPPRLLILGAWDPEIAPLRPLARTLARRAHGPRLVLDVTGVGLVDAALGSEAALERNGLDGAQGDACLFVGTAGLYVVARRDVKTVARPNTKASATAAPRLGHAVLARHLHLASTAVARREGYWPGPLARRLSSDEAVRVAIHTAVPILPLVDVANTLAITSTATLAQALDRNIRAVLKAEGERPLPLVENLEAFAVARACERRNVAFGAVLGLSNEVGPQAHDQWKRLAKSASEQVAAVLSTWLLQKPGR